MALYGPNESFESPEHALITGMVLGLALKHDLDITPVTNEDGYTSLFEIRDSDGGFPEGVKVFIRVEPPVREEKP